VAHHGEEFILGPGRLLGCSQRRAQILFGGAQLGGHALGQAMGAFLALAELHRQQQSKRSERSGTAGQHPGYDRAPGRIGSARGYLQSPVAPEGAESDLDLRASGILGGSRLEGGKQGIRIEDADSSRLIENRIQAAEQAWHIEDHEHGMAGRGVVRASDRPTGGLVRQGEDQDHVAVLPRLAERTADHRSIAFVGACEGGLRCGIIGQIASDQGRIAIEAMQMDDWEDHPAVRLGRGDRCVGIPGRAQELGDQPTLLGRYAHGPTDRHG